MSTHNLLVISDLHLADGATILEGFHPSQQVALEGLLQAALPGGHLGLSSPPMLIINGDCFDFLVLAPYPPHGISTPQIGLEKLEKIAAAHEPFFRALRHFLDHGGSITFMIGNHDIELCFAPVRTHVAALLDPTKDYAERLHFCLDQQFQPFPDVWIEHGNQYDFWNATFELWDEAGKALNPAPQQICLPWGTRYMHSASLPISLHYPYFERFDPSLGITRQIALLCLLDPAMVMEAARQVATLMSNDHQPLRDLQPGEEHMPARLFNYAMVDFAAFMQNIQERVPSWSATSSRLYSPSEEEQRQNDALSLFFLLSMALDQSQEQALEAIFTPPSDAGDEDTTRGLRDILRTHPALHIAIAGHTHITHSEQMTDSAQIYLNTATWTQRLQPPVSMPSTAIDLDWLSHPDLSHSFMPDKTSFVFAHVSTQPGQPSSVHLYAWEGGRDGTYQTLFA